MTTPAPRSAALLLVASLVLVVAGAVLLNVPHSPGTPLPTVPSQPASEASTAPAVHPAARMPRTPAAAPPVTPGGQTGAAPSVSPSTAALPPHGEGVPGDRAIQRALEAAWPADLPAEDERALCMAGAEMLRADATGVGRAKWPRLFGDGAQVVAPAFATARFRVQAVIARRDGASGQAVVHLVWAGTDRGGTYTDGRITDWYFTRTTSRGDPAWTLQPRT